MNYLLE